jgi:dual specificity MAP kinase phosphatase
MERGNIGVVCCCESIKKVIFFFAVPLVSLFSHFMECKQQQDVLGSQQRDGSPSSAVANCNHAEPPGISSVPVLLIERLYLGCKRHAMDIEQLKKLDIRTVINLAKELEPIHAAAAESSEIRFDRYLHLDIVDAPSFDITPYFAEVFLLIGKCCRRADVRGELYAISHSIEKCRLANTNVLLHCHSGISRSCAFGLGYLMTYQR